MAADAAERAAEAAEPAAAGTSGAGSSEDGVEIDPAGGYRLDRGRYVQLAIFCGAQFLGSMPWNIFAPIYLISMARWGVGQQRINALSNAWNIYPAPGSMLALWAMERHGLRSALLVGIVAQTVACVLAWVACLPTALPPHGAYALLYFSQAVGATAQPLVFNNIARLSGDWCARAERAAELPPSPALLACNTLHLRPRTREVGARSRVPGGAAGSRRGSVTWR